MTSLKMASLVSGENDKSKLVIPKRHRASNYDDRVDNTININNYKWWTIDQTEFKTIYYYRPIEEESSSNR